MFSPKNTERRNFGGVARAIDIAVISGFLSAAGEEHFAYMQLGVILTIAGNGSFRICMCSTCKYCRKVALGRFPPVPASRTYHELSYADEPPFQYQIYLGS